MIKLTNDRLAFLFPETHPRAHLEVTFQRTLRIPDDGKTYPLPPGLGAFPVRRLARPVLLTPLPLPFARSGRRIQSACG